MMTNTDYMFTLHIVALLMAQWLCLRATPAAGLETYPSHTGLDPSITHLLEVDSESFERLRSLQ